ncbi:NAD(P)-dependent oxidoreductase [Lacticaseibacillus sp. GG6-2]
MKICAYGVRGDEVTYFQQWAARTANQIALHPDYLTPQTLPLAYGFDALTSFQTVPYASDLFALMAAHDLPYLALRNAGYENVDLTAASAHHIRVSNVPAYSPEAIAEFTVMSMLYLLRQAGAVQTALHDADYQLAKTFMGRQLGHCTVGVIGTGRIGQAVIRMLSGFGTRVLVTDDHLPARSDLTFTPVPMATLLAQSDIVTLHVPGTSANNHLLDDKAMTLMKPGALIINTARPNVIDTTALRHHLRSGKLGGVAIDTFEHEAEDLLQLTTGETFSDPLWDELLAMPNVMLSPHIAYYTDIAVAQMVEQALDNLLAFWQGRPVAAELHE